MYKIKTGNSESELPVFILSSVITNIANQPISPQEENFKRCCINQTDWFNETPIRTLQ
jgi:hypothetical protein